MLSGLFAATLALSVTAGNAVDAPAPCPPGATPRAWLGVTVMAPPFDPATPLAAGLAVARVVPGSPADKAGLREADVLIAVDDRALTSARTLADYLATLEPGRTVELSVRRGDGVLRSSAKLRMRPAELADTGPRTLALPKDPDARLTFAGDRRRASLGVETLDLTPGLAAYFGSPPGRGVLVTNVVEGSPAEAAGLAAGDVALALEGSPLHDVTSLAQVLRQHSPGERVVVTVWRGGQSRPVPVVLGARDVPVWVLDRAGDEATRDASLARAEELRLRAEIEELQQRIAGSRGSRATP